MDVSSLVEVKRNPKIPDIAPGDTVKVSARIVEGGKERIQVFQGVVLKIRLGGAGASFTVRHVAFGIGVERTFPLGSSLVEKVEIVRQGKVRRSRLYYLRGLSGKEARRKIKRVDRKLRQVGEELIVETPEEASEVVPEAAVAETPESVEEFPAAVAEEPETDTVKEPEAAQATEPESEAEPVAEAAVEEIPVVAEEKPTAVAEDSAPDVVEEPEAKDEAITAVVEETTEAVEEKPASVTEEPVPDAVEKPEAVIETDSTEDKTESPSIESANEDTKEKP
jgi:large subunit ribosomal protein L19